MEQINVNPPAEPVTEEIVEERPDGTIVRRRVVREPRVTEVGQDQVNVNVPGTGRPTTKNINISG